MLTDFTSLDPRSPLFGIASVVGRVSWSSCGLVSFAFLDEEGRAVSLISDKRETRPRGGTDLIVRVPEDSEASTEKSARRLTRRKGGDAVA